jgi:hypothetical protein
MVAEPRREASLILISLKSAAVGMLALMGTALMAAVVLFLIYRPYGSRAIAFDPIRLSRSPLLWILALSVFGVGCYFEFRRLTR